MRKLTKPSLEIRNIVQDCVSNMRSNTEKFVDAIPVIEEYSTRFDKLMGVLESYELEPHDMVTEELSKEDMVSLYDNKLSKKGQPGRKYYDKIKIAPINGTCPLCGFGQVATLDHYMAKSFYPTLAVTPSNLIPACRDCNEIRKNVRFDTETDLTLHPYYDDVQNIEWLVAKIVAVSPVCVEYEVSGSLEDEALRHRLEKHMKVFELKRRFAEKAAEEIYSHRNTFQSMIDAGGTDALLSFIQLHSIALQSTEMNSWRTALYKALTNVDQYVVNGKLAF